jgi:hypothetical protein
MIIATSGNDLINYNRIVSSSSSPFTISMVLSQTFRDPIQKIDRRLIALYIIDLNNAVSLIAE